MCVDSALSILSWKLGGEKMRITLFICIVCAAVCFWLVRRQNIQRKRDRKTIISLESQLKIADARFNNLIFENKQSPDVLYDKNGAEYRKVYLRSGAVVYGKVGDKTEVDSALLHYEITF